MKTSLHAMLEKKISHALGVLGYEKSFATVIPSKRPDISHFQCNAPFLIAQKIKKKPLDIANKISTILQKDGGGCSYSVSSPGFINIRIHDSKLNQTARFIRHDRDLGVKKEKKSCRPILIDYGGPNIAKPLHVGHIRSTVIGDCLKRLLRYKGFHVISDIHLGDWGTPMGLLIAELKESGKLSSKNPRITLNDLEAIYPIASQKLKTNPAFHAKALQATKELQSGKKEYVALWKMFRRISIRSLKQIFNDLDVRFDYWYGESAVNDQIPQLLKILQKKKLVKKSNGALIMPFRSKFFPPFLLQKSDGAILYSTTDLATIQQRIKDFHPKIILYVVDHRQSLHFQQLFEAAKLCNWTKKTTCLHIGFGTITGPDGSPFKTREGGIMRLEQLIESAKEKARATVQSSHLAQCQSVREREKISHDVAMSAIKFADLQHHRMSDYAFDLDRMISFTGKTGPYLLYSTIRMRSILKKAKQKKFPHRPIRVSSDTERTLLIHCLQFPDVIDQTIASYAPNILSEHVFRLAQFFNQFYDESHVLRQPKPATRGSQLSLLSLIERIMSKELDILGLKIPKRM